MRTIRTVGWPVSPRASAWTRRLAGAILLLQAAGVISITARSAELAEREAALDATTVSTPAPEGATLLSAPSAARAPLVVPALVAPPATTIATTSTPTSTTTTTPAPPPPPPAPIATPASRLEAAYAASVPAAWRSAIPARLEIISGNTSWAWTDGRIQVGQGHLANDTKLRVTLAHEFGHLIAYRHGTQTYLGAPPAGWPSYSNSPQEAWADCVSVAFTGINDPSHGLPACSGDSLTWARSWLAAGPP